MLAILPEAWIAAWPTWVLLLIVAVAIAVLVRGADWLVHNAAGIAARLGLSTAVIGATIVSLGTTSPEAAVSVLAAWTGNPGLALGNGVGSIIVDTGLIFGLCCLLTQLPADRFLLNRQGWVQLGAPALLAAICYAIYFWQGEEAALARWVGLLLVGLLVAYLAVSVRWSRQQMARAQEGAVVDEATSEADVAARSQRSTLAMSLLGLAGLGLVLVASDVLIGAATELAYRWEVPDVVIAATLVAFGTSLPELVVGLTAVLKKHPGLLVGNIIGADILNILFVIGLSAVAAPLTIVEPAGEGPGRFIFLQLHLPTMLLMLVYFRLCIFRAVATGRFARWMGLPLVIGYVVYLVVQIGLFGGAGH